MISRSRQIKVVIIDEKFDGCKHTRRQENKGNWSSIHAIDFAIIQWKKSSLMLGRKFLTKRKFLLRIAKRILNHFLSQISSWENALFSRKRLDFYQHRLNHYLGTEKSAGPPKIDTLPVVYLKFDKFIAITLDYRWRSGIKFTFLVDRTNQMIGAQDLCKYLCFGSLSSTILTKQPKKTDLARSPHKQI